MDLKRLLKLANEQNNTHGRGSSSVDHDGRLTVTKEAQKNTPQCRIAVYNDYSRANLYSYEYWRQVYVDGRVYVFDGQKGNGYKVQFSSNTKSSKDGNGTRYIAFTNAELSDRLKNNDIKEISFLWKWDGECGAAYFEIEKEVRKEIDNVNAL